MTGTEMNASGICIESTVMYTVAQSPAYVLNGESSIYLFRYLVFVPLRDVVI